MAPPNAAAKGSFATVPTAGKIFILILIVSIVAGGYYLALHMSLAEDLESRIDPSELGIAFGELEEAFGFESGPDQLGQIVGRFLVPLLCVVDPPSQSSGRESMGKEGEGSAGQPFGLGALAGFELLGCAIEPAVR